MNSGPSEKTKIIVLSCLESEIRDTTIKFVSNANEEIYIVARVPLFKSYVKTLLSTSAEATIVLVYKEMDILLELLSLIQEASTQANDNATMSDTKQRSDHQNNQSLSLTKNTSAPSAKGADFPLGFNVIILRSDGPENTNHISETEMALQQTLRFISMKHGATYAAISEDGHRTAEEFGLLTKNLLDPQENLQLYVYDPAGVNFMPGTTLHQLIPNNWDSWKKMALLSKSIPRGTTGQMLETDEDFAVLNEAYNAFFSNTSSSRDSLTSILETRGLLSLRKVRAPLKDSFLTYSDMIALLEAE